MPKNTTHNIDSLLESPYEQIIFLAGMISILKKTPGFESFEVMEKVLASVIDQLPQSQREKLFNLTSEVNR